MSQLIDKDAAASIKWPNIKTFYFRCELSNVITLTSLSSIFNQNACIFIFEIGVANMIALNPIQVPYMQKYAYL